jgi:hypothetical protein
MIDVGIFVDRGYQANTSRIDQEKYAKMGDLSNIEKSFQIAKIPQHLWDSVREL